MINLIAFILCLAVAVWYITLQWYIPAILLGILAFSNLCLFIMR